MTLLFWNLWYSATFYALDGRILSISAVCSTSLRTQTMTHNWCVVHMIYIWRYTFRTEDRLLNDKSMEQEPELFDSVPRVNFTLWTTEKCIMEHTQLETNVHGKLGILWVCYMESHPQPWNSSHLITDLQQQFPGKWRNPSQAFIFQLEWATDSLICYYESNQKNEWWVCCAVVYSESQLKTTFPLRNAQEPQHLSKTKLSTFSSPGANFTSTEWRRKNIYSNTFMKLWFSLWNWACLLEHGTLKYYRRRPHDQN